MSTTSARVRMPRAQREEQILAVAEEVFSTRGYQSATMEDVADRVGVTKPLIYEYFGSKEGLLGACVERTRLQLREATLQTWSSVGHAASVEQVLRVSVRTFFEFIDEHRAAFALLQHEGALAVSTGAGVERLSTGQADVVAQLLGDLPGAPGVSPLVLEGYAEAVGGACERVAVWRLRRSGVTADLAADLVMTTVWAGLASQFPTDVTHSGTTRPGATLPGT